jgi:ATP-dependent DNA helicase RecG
VQNVLDSHNLMTSHKLSENAKTRIQTMTRTSDGFEIAEVDLRLRGPGDLTGTQQSGVLNLRIADIIRDHEILKIARACASQILKEDPSLDLPQYLPIKNTYLQMAKYRNIWNYIS